jgi:capsular exopolysaccharide synthesis family protein
MQDVNSNNSELAVSARQQDIDIKFLFAKVFGNWYWYLFTLFILTIIAVLVYLYVAPRYTVTGRTMVTGYNPQGKSPSGTDESTVLQNLGTMFSVPNSVSNEMEIMHSRTLVEKTVRDLQLNVTYWAQGQIRFEESYKNSPFFIKELELKYISSPIKYDIRVIDHGTKVHFEDEYTDSTFTMSFGDTIHTYYGSWVLLKNPNVTEKDPHHTLGMVINGWPVTLAYYMQNITATNVNEYVNIIDLSIGGPTPQKNEDLLKYLIDLYIQADINEHNRIADSTIAFINTRLESVSSALTSVDKNIESFKKENNLTDLTNDANQLLQTSTTINQSMQDKQVQYKVVDDLERYLSDAGNNTRVMPTTAPISDPAFVQTLDKYNSLELKRQSLLQTSTEANPDIKSIDIQLGQLRGDLLSMLRTYKKGLNTEQDDLVSRNSQMQGSIQKVPTQQRTYLDFTRQQNVLQGLYSYLLQTREQTAVSKSNSLTDVRIIDEPIRGPQPYFPSIIILTIAVIFLGLVIPSLVLFLRELLNKRVISTDDITNTTNVPVVANISHVKSKRADKLVVLKDTRTEVSEQFRTLRTNLQFLMPGAAEKVILFTSSMGGEGKSFVLLNLASAIALSGRKVLMMELDLRKPNIYPKLNVNDSIGFSNYIISDIKPRDIIQSTDVHPNLYFVGPGTVPPNPSEILSNSKVQQLFDDVRNQFDYILVDSAPIGLVTDALLLNKYADMVLYIVRQRYTYKKQMNLIQGIANDKRFKKMNIVLNDVKQLPGYASRYGSKRAHGYYYGEEKRSVFSKMLGKKRRTSQSI